MKLSPLALTCIALAATAASAEPPRPAPEGLMCELLAHPERVEIADPRPDFSWVVRSADPDDVQSAYQIRVAATPEALARGEAPLWDSGRVASDLCTAVEYAGPALEPWRSYAWQVRTWGRGEAPSGWSAPQVFRAGALDGYATPRHRLVQSEVGPASIGAAADGGVFLDFGRAAFAGLRLSLEGPASGGDVVVHLGEALEAPGKILRKPPGSVRYHRAVISLLPGRHDYNVPLADRDTRRMPAEIGPVMPFRYVEIEGASAPIGPDAARQVVAFYPFDDQAARFASSDPKLDAVWEMCKYSMKATSFCGLFVDGDRERLPYEADAYINQLGWYACDREFTLPRLTHEYLMDNPTWPPEWKHHSVLMAWHDYLYTGDADSLAACYDRLKSEKLLAHRARADGLLDTTGLRDLVDWPVGERDGFDFKPVNTIYNAFYHRSLALMAEIAEALEKAEDAATFRAEAARVAAAIEAKLVDAATGLYVDGEGSAHSSLHANMMPLAFGLVPEGRRGRVVEFVKSRGMACSVYAAQYLMDALFDADEADHAYALMLAPGDRSWRHMVEGVGTTIALEAWDQKYKPNQDWNHAWGAAPANLIPRKLMGVEPVEPGFRTVRIRPRPGPLESASLDLPTIRGTIRVDFRASPESFAMGVEIPANVRAQVHVPAGARADDVVQVDGAPRAARREGDALVVEPIGSGTHQIVRELR